MAADILISQLPQSGIARNPDLFVFDQVEQDGSITSKSITYQNLISNIKQIDSLKFQDGDYFNPSITFLNETNTGFYRVKDDPNDSSDTGIGVTVRSTKTAVFKSQRLGINVSHPVDSLHVVGTAQVNFAGNNVLHFNGSQGMPTIEAKNGYGLTFRTNNVNQTKILGTGEILIGTDNLETDCKINIVGGHVEVDGASFGGYSQMAEIGINQGGGKQGFLYVNKSGAVGNYGLDFGKPGQVLVSRGPTQPFEWQYSNVGDGTGGASGLTFKGAINVSQPAPLNPENGDFYLSVVAGTTHPSFSINVYAEPNAFVVYSDDTGWFVTNTTASSSYVDLTTNQTVDGNKTFLQTIIGTVQNCARNVIAGEGMKGGGVLNGDVILSVDAGAGLEIDPSNNLVVKPGDDTITVDSTGVRVNKEGLLGGTTVVNTFNGRSGEVLPKEGDYNLQDLGDVAFIDGTFENNVLMLKGSMWSAQPLNLPKVFQFKGTVDAVAEAAPAGATEGDVYVNTREGVVLNDVSWTTLAGQRVEYQDLLTRSVDNDGNLGDWIALGSLADGVGEIEIKGQNGIVVLGTPSEVILEVDDTVVRTTGDYTLEGNFTFEQDLTANVTGNLQGTADNCATFVNTGTGLSGGGQLTENITLEVDDTVTRTEGDYFITGDWTFDRPVNVNIIGDVTGSVSQCSRLVNAGDGLIGGGQLINDITLHVDDTVIRTSGDATIYGKKKFIAPIDGDLDGTADKCARNVVAGAGLSGGGTLSQDIRFDVDESVLRVGGSYTITGIYTFLNPINGSILGSAEKLNNQVIAGDGLMGGGMLTEDVTINVDSSVVRTSGDQTIFGTKTFSANIVGNINGEARDCGRQVVAGNGLYGGGKLNTDRSLHVNEGQSIEVVDDKVEVKAGPGLERGSNGLVVDLDWFGENYSGPGNIGNGGINLVAGSGGGMSVSGSNAKANQSETTTWTVAVDSSVIRTSGAQTISGTKNFVGTTYVDNLYFTNLMISDLEEI